MEFLNIFLEVIAQEKKTFNLNESKFITFTTALTSKLTESFNVPYNRCAYMYRYATVHTHFVKECISKFLSEYSGATDLLALWRSHSDLALCSLSCGPGLDYLSFILAVLEFGETPDTFNKVNIISNTGAWRTTISLLSDSLTKAEMSSSVPKGISFKNVDVFQIDFKKGFRADMITILLSSEVVMMVKTLNLEAPASEDEEAYLLSNFEALVSSLRPETTIFFIDTKPSVSLMLKVLAKSFGTYLYGPIHVPYVHPVTYPEILRETLKVLPVQSARGTFFVWKKFPLHLLPDSPVPPDCIQPVEFGIENIHVSASTTEFPVGVALAKSSSIISDTKSLNNSTLLNSSRAESQSSNISPGPSKPGNTKMNSPVFNEDSFCSNLKSKLSFSSSSSHSDILDSVLTEILNSPPSFKPLTAKEIEDFESFHDTKESSKMRFSVAGSSHADPRICNETESPSDKTRSPEYVVFPSPNIAPRNIGDVDSEPSFSLSSDRRNYKKREVIQNLIDGKYSSHLQSSLESKLTQTDPSVEIATNHSDSIKFLTHRINKLISAFEKELAQQKDLCKSHGTHFNSCHGCSFSAQVHRCTSLPENCDKFRKNEDNSLDESVNRAQTCDTHNGVRCVHCCFATACCTRPIQGQCCQGQQTSQSHSSSGALFLNSPVNVTVPSIVIPLESISMDVLSQLLSDVKINMKSS